MSGKQIPERWRGNYDAIVQYDLPLPILKQVIEELGEAEAQLRSCRGSEHELLELLWRAGQ